MKIISSSLLLFVLTFVSAQDDIKSIIDKYPEGCFLVHSGNSTSDCIKELAGLPRNKIDDLVKYAKSSDDHFEKYVIISALGSMCTPKDTNAIRFIEDMVYSNPSQRKTARDAIFRIGGKPLDDFLTYILLKDDFELQTNSIESFWIIDKLSVLKILEKHVKRTIKERPNWKITRLFLSNDFSTRLNFAIQVLENPNDKESKQGLEDILAYKKPYFNLPGGKGQNWAKRMLKQIASTSEKD